MKVHASITDFPVLFQLETFFKKFKEAGVDGLELVLGVKSRFEYARIAYLSEKYDLPIASIHQPPWSGIGLFFDESFIAFAKKLGVEHIVFHPLSFQSFDSSAMKHYFSRLVEVQEKYNVRVLLENVSWRDIGYRKLFQYPHTSAVDHLSRLNEVADTYGFLLTYDVSHAELVTPQKEKVFLDMFGKIGNIHLSSFSNGHHHLPLTMGDFDTATFLPFLEKRKYKGLLTLEVRYPKLMTWYHYDFSGIASSVSEAKRVSGK